MKSFFMICFLMVGALIFISCSSDKTDGPAETAETAEQAEHAGHAHTAATEDDGLVLNDGAKWQMDDHTRASFVQMAASFEKVDAAALGTAGLKLAGDGLKKDLEGLIQGCTMTGADHDQLHVYLMKYIPAVTALQESGSVADAKMVQHYLSIYGDYFE
ncbi:MAG: hypothetical protein QNL91_07920 [Candidatus Krumholzibacteria bacterium]|nr:hypothetical protein [Candidatus Krumholzibacteria bacterium]